MKRIVHIANDEKFINSAREQFQEAFPDQNSWIIIHDSKKELKYINKMMDMHFVEELPVLIREMASSLSEDAVICVHGLDYYRSILINTLSRKQKIVWFLWGMEFYNNPYIFSKKEILGNSTNTYFFSKGSVAGLKDRFKNLFRQPTYLLLQRTNSPHREVLKSIKRADYCAVLYEEEIDFIQTKLAIKPQFLKYSYYPLEKMVSNEDLIVTNSNILLGNSASSSNNHIEAMEILSSLKLQDRKIIVPLSYGDDYYRDGIKSFAEDLLRDHFEPLEHFMPIEEYNNHLQQCGIVVMNHYRQQAVGNVLAMLWMGAKVYLDERNTLYHYLKRIGITVFSIKEDLTFKNPDVLKLLSREIQLEHRNILKAQLSSQVLNDLLKSQINKIL